jgi:hypothetical protein
VIKTLLHTNAILSQNKKRHTSKRSNNRTPPKTVLVICWRGEELFVEGNEEKMPPKKGGYKSSRIEGKAVACLTAREKQHK